MRIFRLVLVLAATGCLLPGSALAIVGDEPSPSYFPGSSTSGVIVTATTPLAVPLNCDDCAGNVALPFAFDFLGHHYAAGDVIHPTSNGVLDFDGTTSPFANQCAPTYYATTHVAMPLWDDLVVSGAGEGVFTSVIGTAPFRRFVIEWRAHLQSGGAAGSVNFEVVLDEQQPLIQFIYGAVAGAGATATIGISQSSTGGSVHKQFSCNTALGAIKTVGYAFNPPTISGLVQQGETLTAAPGTYVGTPTPTQSVQWERCNASHVCAAIPGALGTDYTSVAADVGSTVRAVVTSLNIVGTATTHSYPYGPIAALPGPAPVYTAAASSGASLVHGVDDIGNHSDDDSTPVALPFTIRVYGRSYSAVNVSANGSLGFGGIDTSYTSACLPNERGPDVFEVYQSDLDSTSPGDGIFTTVTGLAPHRRFVVEWRTAKHGTLAEKSDFEAILYEDSPTLTAIYGDTVAKGAEQVSDVQHGQGPPSTQFSCGTATLTNGTRVDYTPSAPVVSGSPTVGSTLGATATSWSATPTLARQWRRCDAEGFSCGDIPEAAAATYTVTAADLGHTLRLREIVVGPVTPVAESAPTAVIAAPATPAPQPPAGTGADTTAPRLTGLAFARSAFKALTRGGPTDPKRGTPLTFRLTEAARVRFTVSALLSGRRSGARCVTPAKARRGAKHCTRLVALKGAFTVTGRKGVNTLRLTGRLAGRPLPRGAYRLSAVASDAAKNTGKPVVAGFTIKR